MVVVDTRDHILSTFDRALSMYADEEFKRQGIDVIHNSRVRASQLPATVQLCAPLHAGVSRRMSSNEGYRVLRARMQSQ